MASNDRGTVLITGATGNVGRYLVRGLADRDARVRALTRDPRAAAFPDGIEAVGGDLSDAGSLEPALDGVEAVFLLWPFFTVDDLPTFLDLVGRRTDRIVFLSSGGGWQADPIPSVSFHADAEAMIEHSPLDWTFLRPSGFASNALMWASQIRAGDIVRWPYAAATRSLIHERDIAAAAVEVLTTEGHSGARYQLTGPELLTHAEQIGVISEAIGRTLRLEEISREAAREMLLAAWGDASSADLALDAWAEFVNRPELLTTGVEDLTGSPATTFRDWADDHAGDFR